MRNNILFVLIIVGIAAVPSCKKVQENKIIKGEWEAERVETDFLTVDNAMTFLLPGYEKGPCCKYIINFKDDETCTGTFTKDGVVMQVDDGEWYLTKFNQVYVKLGAYIDGVYDIDRQNRKFYILSTNNNATVFVGNPINAKVTMDIRRIDL